MVKNIYIYIYDFSVLGRGFVHYGKLKYYGKIHLISGFNRLRFSGHESWSLLDPGQGRVHPGLTGSSRRHSCYFKCPLVHLKTVWVKPSPSMSTNNHTSLLFFFLLTTLPPTVIHVCIIIPSEQILQRTWPWKSLHIQMYDPVSGHRDLFQLTQIIQPEQRIPQFWHFLWI